MILVLETFRAKAKRDYGIRDQMGPVTFYENIVRLCFSLVSRTEERLFLEVTSNVELKDDSAGSQSQLQQQTAQHPAGSCDTSVGKKTLICSDKSDKMIKM